MSSGIPEDLGSKRARLRTNKNYVRGPQHIGAETNESSGTNLTVATTEAGSASILVAPESFDDHHNHHGHGNDSIGARAKREQVSRACQRCATSKRKCSGTFPCTRCIRLDAAHECVEVIVKRKHNTGNGLSTTTTMNQAYTTDDYHHHEDTDDLQHLSEYPNESLTAINPLVSVSPHHNGTTTQSSNNRPLTTNGRRRSTVQVATIGVDGGIEPEDLSITATGARTIGKRRQMSSALTQNDVNHIDDPTQHHPNPYMNHPLPSSMVPMVPYFSAPLNELVSSSMNSINTRGTVVPPLFYGQPSTVVLTSGPTVPSINNFASSLPSASSSISSTSLGFTNSTSNNKPYINTMYYPPASLRIHSNSTMTPSYSNEPVTNGGQFLSPDWWSRTNSVDNFPAPSSLSPSTFAHENSTLPSSVRLARNKGYTYNNSTSDTESITQESMTTAFANTHLHDGTHNPSTNEHHHNDNNGNNGNKRVSEEDLLMSSSVDLLLRLSGEKVESEVTELGKQLLVPSSSSLSSDTTTVSFKPSKSSKPNANAFLTLSHYVSSSFPMRIINNPDNPCLEIAPQRYISLRPPPEVQITAQTDLLSVTPFPAVRLRFPDNSIDGIPDHVETNKEANELFGIDPDALHLLPAHHNEIVWMHPEDMPHRKAAITAVREIQAPYLEWSGRYVQMHKNSISVDNDPHHPVSPSTAQYGYVEGTSVRHSSTTSTAHESITVPHYALFIAWERIFLDYYPSGDLRTAMSIFTNVQPIEEELSSATVEALRYSHQSNRTDSTSSITGYLASSLANNNTSTVNAGPYGTTIGYINSNMYYPPSSSLSSLPLQPVPSTTRSTSLLGFGFDAPLPSHNGMANASTFVRGKRTSSERIFGIGNSSDGTNNRNSMGYDYVSPNTSSYVANTTVHSTYPIHPSSMVTGSNGKEKDNLRISSSSDSLHLLSAHPGTSMQDSGNYPNSFRPGIKGSTLRNSIDYEITPRESFSIMLNNNNNSSGDHRLSNDTPTSNQSIVARMRDNSINSNRSSIDSLTEWSSSTPLTTSHSNPNGPLSKRP